MADDENTAFDQDEIERLFNKGKSSGEAYPFAFGLAAKPEECGLMVHLHKPPATLKKDLKQSSKAIRKVCFGTFTMDGADVRFSTEKPLKGLVKQLKKKFRDVGMGKYRPVLVGPDGQEIDEDSLPDDQGEDEDENEDAAPDVATEAPQQQAPDTAALRERLVKVKAGIEALPKDKAGPLVQAFARVVGLVKEGKVAEAAPALDIIEKALQRMATEAPPAAPPPPPTQAAPAPQAAPQAQPSDLGARLTAMLSAMVPRLRALPPGPVQTALAGQIRTVQGMIVAGDTTGATAALRALAEALVQAEAAPAQEAPAGPKPQDIWNAAKEAADAGIAKLQTALRGIGHPDTTRIAEFGMAGLSGGQVQTRLMAALMSHARASGDDRAKAEVALRTAIGEYKVFLSTNPLVALCDTNPFGVALDLRGGLGQALDRIEGTLAA